MADSPIQAFFESSEFAVVGASANRMKVGNKLLRIYIDHDVSVHPINPTASEIESLPALRSLADLPSPTTTAVSVITQPGAVIPILEEAERLGVKKLWLQPGAIDENVRKWVAQYRLKHGLAMSPVLGQSASPFPGPEQMEAATEGQDFEGGRSDRSGSASPARPASPSATGNDEAIAEEAEANPLDPANAMNIIGCAGQCALVSGPQYLRRFASSRFASVTSSPTSSTLPLRSSVSANSLSLLRLSPHKFSDRPNLRRSASGGLNAKGVKVERPEYDFAADLSSEAFEKQIAEIEQANLLRDRRASEPTLFQASVSGGSSAPASIPSTSTSGQKSGTNLRPSQTGLPPVGNRTAQPSPLAQSFTSGTSVSPSSDVRSNSNASGSTAPAIDYYDPARHNAHHYPPQAYHLEYAQQHRRQEMERERLGAHSSPRTKGTPLQGQRPMKLPPLTQPYYHNDMYAVFLNSHYGHQAPSSSIPPPPPQPPRHLGPGVFDSYSIAHTGYYSAAPPNLPMSTHVFSQYDGVAENQYQGMDVDIMETDDLGQYAYAYSVSPHAYYAPSSSMTSTVTM